MDASSIITQVPRDEDHVNANSFPPPDRGLCYLLRPFYL